MHIVDITMFHAPTSGGVRSYLTHKHRYLSAQPGIRHSILVPGSTASHDGSLHTLPAPPLGRTGYRVPLRGAAWTQALCRLRPALIEAGDPYRLAWAALAAGQRIRVRVPVSFANEGTCPGIKAGGVLNVRSEGLVAYQEMTNVADGSVAATFVTTPSRTIPGCKSPTDSTPSRNVAVLNSGRGSRPGGRPLAPSPCSGRPSSP